METFPPNSDRAKAEPDTITPEEKKVEQVTAGPVQRRKKPLGKRFQETFVSGDAKNALHFVLFTVLIPAAKDAIVEAGSQGIERMVFGEARKGSRGVRPGGATGHVSYNRMSMNDSPPTPNLSRRARARHDFDEIVLQTRGEAEEVIERLYDLLSRYESATVADLYELTGIKSSYTDQKWGWTQLRGAGVARVRNGYLLDLPEPEPLD